MQISRDSLRWVPVSTRLPRELQLKPGNSNLNETSGPQWAEMLLVGAALVALNAYTLLRVLVPGFARVA